MMSTGSPLAALAVALVTGAVANAQEAPDWRDTAEYRLLEEAWTFTDSAVGDSGETPSQVHALRFLLVRQDAVEALGDLIQRAQQPAGRLLALTGLGAVDYDAYLRARDDLLEREREVEVPCQMGCIGFRRTLGEVIFGQRPDDLFRIEGRLGEELCWGPPLEGPTVDDLREGLRSDAVERRVAAAQAIARRGPPARAALPELLACVRAGGRERRPALRALWALGCWAAASEAPELLWDLAVDPATPSEHLLPLLLTLEHLVGSLALARGPDAPLPAFAERLEPLPPDAAQAAGVLDLEPERPERPIDRLRPMPDALLRRVAPLLDYEESGFVVGEWLGRGGAVGLELLLEAVDGPGWERASYELWGLAAGASPDDRERVRACFERLLLEGDDEQRELARDALESLAE
jgi:hypothetical protein